MPELPEVETTLRGIQPHIEGQPIKQVVIRHRQLRWPIPREISQKLAHQKLKSIQRRAKYLLFQFSHGTLIIHLGMSGTLRIMTNDIPAKKHDHVDIVFANGKILRFTDPRRFGAVLWTEDPIELHPLLKQLGPEPLAKNFSGKHLWQRAQRKKLAVKSFIMDSKIVVGVGNIYAAEALFLAKIHPESNVNTISLHQYEELAKSIKTILRLAIKKGGTTLKDFVNSQGKPGYFSHSLKVYGRSGLNCYTCKNQLLALRLAQRNSVFCPFCQKKS